jgi:multisubunit Na+/H+ antiporter MnhF subunit
VSSPLKRTLQTTVLAFDKVGTIMMMLLLLLLMMMIQQLMMVMMMMMRS